MGMATFIMKRKREAGAKDDDGVGSGGIAGSLESTLDTDSDGELDFHDENESPSDESTVVEQTEKKKGFFGIK